MYHSTVGLLDSLPYSVQICGFWYSAVAWYREALVHHERHDFRFHPSSHRTFQSGPKISSIWNFDQEPLIASITAHGVYGRPQHPVQRASRQQHCGFARFLQPTTITVFVPGMISELPTIEKKYAPISHTPIQMKGQRRQKRSADVASADTVAFPVRVSHLTER